MKIEKNMFQTKKHQDKTPEKELHETEVSSCLLDEEFKVTVMKMTVQTNEKTQSELQQLEQRPKHSEKGHDTTEERNS